VSLTRTVITALVLAALSAAAGGPSRAQSASSSLAGNVRFEDGTPLSGAVVEARAQANGSVRSTVSDARGRYRIDGLGPGEWVVMARVGDGGPSDSRTVSLHLQRTTRVDFSVGVGLAEQITVRAAMPLVDRKQTAGKMIITGERANALPLAGRVFTDLALLDSSVGQAAPGNFFGERGAVFSVNGQSGRSNSFLVDGLDNNDSTSGTTLNSFFSQQVIQEFVLLTHQYSPEFGRAAGGLLNIVTRRGSNERTWDGFFQGTSDGWNDPGGLVESLPDRGVSRDASRRFQTGVTVGGPFARDRAFYFVAYEHQEADDVIAYTGLDRESFGAPGSSGTGINPDDFTVGPVGGRTVAPSDDDNFFVRMDFNLGRANTLMLRLSADDRTTSGVNVGGVIAPEAGFIIDEQDYQLGVTWTSVISPTLLSETRFLAGFSRFDQRAASARTGVNHPSGVYGGNTLQRQQRDEDKYQILQNFTLHRGGHVLKLGLDVTRSTTHIAALFNPNGTVNYDYDIPFTLGDCVDLFPSDLQLGQILDPPHVPCGNGEPAHAFSYAVSFALVRGQPEATLRDTQIAVFVQDRVEVGKRWFLDYGLRYDVGSYELPSSARVESTVANGGAGRDTDNLAPRFGFTFAPSPDKGLVVRGGAGVFYDKLVLAFPAVAAVTSGTDILLMFPQGFADEETNEDFIDENGVDSILALQDADFLEFLKPLVLKFSTGTELETPYTVQYNLGVEYGIGRFWAVRADVIRALGYHLPLMKDLNPVSGLLPPGLPCTAENLALNLDTSIVVPCHLADPENVGSIAAIVTEGRSWYTGVDLGLRWDHDDNWLNASYTWSDSEDLGFDPLKGGISLPPNSTHLGAERGRSDGHREHRLVVSGETGIWAGVRTSVVVQLASGIPYNVTTGQDDNLDGFINDRPDGVGRNAGENASLTAINALRDQVFFPLAPVTSLDEPSFFQVDARLFWPFGIGDKNGRGELFLQVFNLLDRDNWGLIEGRAISPNFGRPITLAGPPRTLELGFRIGY